MINGSFERELISACKVLNFIICLTPKFCVILTNFKNFESDRILKASVSAHEFGKFGKPANRTFEKLQCGPSNLVSPSAQALSFILICTL